MAAKGAAPAVALSSGHRMPAVGLGVWRMEKPAIRTLILSALRIGYRHLDCAGKPPTPPPPDPPAPANPTSTDHRGRRLVCIQYTVYPIQ